MASLGWKGLMPDYFLMELLKGFVRIKGDSEKDLGEDCYVE
jgi:hypothetical protein